MTDKRIPLYAQYGYAKVEEITPEQWEALVNRNTPYMVVTEESSVVLQIIPDAQQIIKAAVQAIEDVMPSSHDQCPKNSVCHLCDIMTLEPTLEALKGLIDG